MTTSCAAARRALIAIVAIASIARGVFAQDVDHDLYVAALARERAVRSTFAGSPAPDTAVKEVHAVVTAYQTLVRRFPASGYSDDALWNAGRLELDAFARFGETRDKDVGTRLLQRLAADYPTSKLAKRVSETLTTFASAKPAEPAKPAIVKAAAPPPPPIVAKAIPVAYGPTPAIAVAPIATIRSVKRAVLADVVRLVIELDGEVPFHD